MSEAIGFNPIYLKTNQGHRKAPRVSIVRFNNDIEALMDAGDISLPWRFKRQLQCFLKDKTFSIVEGQIPELLGDDSNIIEVRRESEKHGQIVEYAKKRRPINQVSVMFKKNIVEMAGGYLQYINNTTTRFWGEVVFSTKRRVKAFKLLRAGANDAPKGSIDGSDEQRSSIKEENHKRYPPFSVAICVYGKDNPEWFDLALASIINQTVKPSEIVLVVDGPVPDEIQHIIAKYAEFCKSGGVLLQVVKLEKNAGLGNALKIAVEKSSYELIARMDSDDISSPNRFEQQLMMFERDPQIDIVGGDIAEFIKDEGNIVGMRCVPCEDKQIKVYMKKRCAMNHVSVMYKKSAVQTAGGYLDWFWNEDYYLWIRMQLNGAVFANTGTVLVNVRVGKDMYTRRGGDKYFKSEIGIQKFMREKGMINRQTYVSNCLKRFIVQKMMPNSVRGWVFKKFARN